MTRAIAIILAGMLVAGSKPLPLPPPLPADPPTDCAAPVPDAGLLPPNRTGSGGTAFSLRLYSMRKLGTSDGYIPGSAYQSPEQRRPMQPPGFMVTVPLQ